MIFYLTKHPLQLLCIRKLPIVSSRKIHNVRLIELHNSLHHNTEQKISLRAFHLPDSTKPPTTAASTASSIIREGDLARRYSSLTHVSLAEESLPIPPARLRELQLCNDVKRSLVCARGDTLEGQNASGEAGNRKDTAKDGIESGITSRTDLLTRKPRTARNVAGYTKRDLVYRTVEQLRIAHVMEHATKLKVAEQIEKTGAFDLEEDAKEEDYTMHPERDISSVERPQVEYPFFASAAEKMVEAEEEDDKEDDSEISPSSNWWFRSY